MAELKTYTYTADDGREVTLRLSDEDAKKRGLTADTKKAPTTSNKSRTAQDK